MLIFEGEFVLIETTSLFELVTVENVVAEQIDDLSSTSTLLGGLKVDGCLIVVVRDLPGEGVLEHLSSIISTEVLPSTIPSWFHIFGV